MNISEIQNSDVQPALSSVTIFLIILISGGAFTIKKSQKKPLYTRLNPDWVFYGFANINKIDLTAPKYKQNMGNCYKPLNKFVQKLKLRERG